MQMFAADILGVTSWLKTGSFQNDFEMKEI